ncbi:MAG: hypothetical protein AAGF48_12890 [Pseudomonadota bacterium]
MRSLLFAALLFATPALADNAEIDADQEACFGSETQDACVNNTEAYCTWVTKTETLTEDGSVDVSWCEMTLPWSHKE